MNEYFLTHYLEYSIDFIKEFIDISKTIELTTGSGLLARLIGIPYIILSATDLSSNHCYEELLYKQHKLTECINQYKPDVIILGVYENLYNINAEVLNSPIVYGVSERWIYEHSKIYISISDRELIHSKDIEKIPHLLHMPSDVYLDLSPEFKNVIRVWKNNTIA